MYGGKLHKGPYTYLLVHIPSGKKYYGARYATGCSTEDLWQTYFSSSKAVRELIDCDGKDSFIVEIRRVFDIPQEAISWEGRVLRKIRARQNINFINMHNNDGLIGLCGDSNPMRNPEHLETWKKSYNSRPKNKKLSEQHKKSISNSLKGRIRSDEERRNISSGLRGIKRTDEYKKVCRERQLGITPSLENRRKKSIAIKGRKKYTNGIVNILCFPDHVPDGFVKGATKSSLK